MTSFSDSDSNAGDNVYFLVRVRVFSYALVILTSLLRSSDLFSLPHPLGDHTHTVHECVDPAHVSPLPRHRDVTMTSPAAAARGSGAAEADGIAPDVQIRYISLLPFVINFHVCYVEISERR